MMHKKKKFKFFGAIFKAKPEVLLTVTTSEKEALEYVNIIIKMNHLFHYKLWCDMRNFSLDSEKAWLQYFNDCVTEEEKFSYNIITFYYDIKTVASLARMFGGCIPLGASFDDESEYDLLKSKIETNALGPSMVKVVELNRDINPRQVEIVWKDTVEKENNKDDKK